MTETNVKERYIVKRISSSKFEIYNESTLPESEKVEYKCEKTVEETEKSKDCAVATQADAQMTRQSVIQKAPPAPKILNDSKRKVESPILPSKKRKTENNKDDSFSNNVILIKDAIMYRIVDILMWSVVGENQLKVFGYPAAPTHQVLWRVVYNNRLRQEAKKLTIEQYSQDHDCGGNIDCFTNHVYQFLEIYAPNLWKRAGWVKFSAEEILRRLYYEELIPRLRNVYLRNNINILQCHSDIVLLEKWEKQKFTAVTWSGQKYFYEMSINCPKCPWCSNKHF